MYDGSGEEVFTRIDYDRKLFILSDRCRGRHAVLAALTMMLGAWEHDTNGQPMDYNQLSAVASVMERFLVDMGLEDAATQRLSSSPPRQSNRTWPIVRRSALVASLLGCTAAAWWAAERWRDQPSDAPLSPQALVVNAAQGDTALSPPPELAHDSLGKKPVHTPYAGALGPTAAHPSGRAFVITTADNEILRIDRKTGSRHRLATTRNLVLWLSISPNGRYLAACDLDKNLYLIPWDGDSPPQSFSAEGSTPLIVWANDDGRLTWLGDQANLFVTDPQSGSTTRCLGYEQAVPASSGRDAAGLVRRTDRGRTVEVEVRGQPLSITTRLPDGQSIHGVDASQDLRTVAVILSDGLLLLFHEQGEGNYRLHEQSFAKPPGNGQVRVSENGQFAYVATDRVYQLELPRMRTLGVLDLPEDTGPIQDLVWRESNDEIVVSTPQQGLSWR